MCRRTTSEFMFTCAQKSKTYFAEDIEFSKGTPIFSTSKRPLIFIKNGMVDDRKTEMMAVRWKIISFNYQIALSRFEKKVRKIDRHFTLVFTLGISGWFEMHGRLLSAKDLAQMQYSQKRLVMDFYLQFFSSNLDFTSDPSQVFRFLVYLTKKTSWASKSGFCYPDRSCVGIRDFQAKLG